MTGTGVERIAMRRIGALLAAFLALGQPAWAQQPSQAQASAIRQACRADYQAHCAGVPTGGQAALACLQSNAASLSAPCQNALSAVGGGAAAAPAPAQPAPAPSAAAPAPATPPPTAPPAPAAAAPAPPPMSPRQELMLVRQACGYDYRRYCRGVPFGGGRVLACLQGNADRLSRPCGRALQAAGQGR